MAVRIPDKNDSYFSTEFFSMVKYAGPVAPPMADRASFSEIHLLKKMCQVSWLLWPVFDEPALGQILLDLNFLAPASIESGKSQEVEKPEVDHLLLLQKLLHSETLKLKKNQSFSHFFSEIQTEEDFENDFGQSLIVF